MVENLKDIPCPLSLKPDEEAVLPVDESRQGVWRTRNVHLHPVNS